MKKNMLVAIWILFYFILFYFILFSGFWPGAICLIAGASEVSGKSMEGRRRDRKMRYFLFHFILFYFILFIDTKVPD